MARRRIEDENKRKLFGLANNKSTAITLPIRMMRDLGFKIGDDVLCSITKNKDGITIKKI